MAALTIRNLDEDVKAKLRIRAAHNGRSMEAEVREILDEAVNGGRESMRRIPDFSGPEWDSYGPEDEDDSDSRPTESAEDDFVQSVRRRFLAIGGVELDIPPRTGRLRIPDSDASERYDHDEQNSSNPGDPQPTSDRSNVIAMLAALGIDDVPAELSPLQIEEIHRLVYDGPPAENVAQTLSRVFTSLGGVQLESPRRGREARWVDFSE